MDDYSLGFIVDWLYLFWFITRFNGNYLGLYLYSMDLVVISWFPTIGL